MLNRSVHVDTVLELLTKVTLDAEEVGPSEDVVILPIVTKSERTEEGEKGRWTSFFHVLSCLDTPCTELRRWGIVVIGFEYCECYRSCTLIIHSETAHIETPPCLRCTTHLHPAVPYTNQVGTDECPRSSNPHRSMPPHSLPIYTPTPRLPHIRTPHTTLDSTMQPPSIKHVQTSTYTPAPHSASTPAPLCTQLAPSPNAGAPVFHTAPNLPESAAHQPTPDSSVRSQRCSAAGSRACRES